MVFCNNCRYIEKNTKLKSDWNCSHPENTILIASDTPNLKPGYIKRYGEKARVINGDNNCTLYKFSFLKWGFSSKESCNY